VASFDKENVCVEHKIEVDGEDYDYMYDDDSLDCLSVFQSFMKLWKWEILKQKNMLFLFANSSSE